MGIEPTLLAWEAKVLPLNYTRIKRRTEELRLQIILTPTSFCQWKTQMEILLNGQPYQIPSPCSLSLLLQQLSLENKRLAVEINLNIVPRSEYESRKLHAGDRVEIVHAIGGG